MNEHEQIIDLSNMDAKRQFMSLIGRMSGIWRVTLKEHKPHRSLKANAFYWAAVVPTFQQFMREHGQYFEKDEVHEFFLQKFSSHEVVDPLTGEVLAVVGRRTSKMDQDEFSAFLNHVTGWMVDRFAVVVPEHAMFGEEVHGRKRIASKAHEQKQLTQAQGH